MRRMSLTPRFAPTDRAVVRRGSIAATLLGSELTVIALVLVALSAALLAGTETSNAKASTTPSKANPIRGIAVLGPQESMVAVLSDDRCIIHDLHRDESFGVWLRTNEERVTVMAASPVESRLFLCRGLGNTNLLDGESGKVLWSQTIDGGFPTSATYSPDGQWIAVGTDHGSITFLSNETGEFVHQLHVDAPVHDVCFTSDSRHFMVALHDTELGVWDAMTFQKVRSIPILSVPGRVIAVAVHPDGERIALGTSEGVISLQNLTSQQELRRHRNAHLPILNVAFTRDGSTVVAGGCDGKISQFAAEADSNVRTVKAHSDAVRSIAFVGDTMVSGGYDGVVRKWNVTTNRELPFDRRY